MMLEYLGMQKSSCLYLAIEEIFFMIKFIESTRGLFLKSISETRLTTLGDVIFGTRCNWIFFLILLHDLLKIAIKIDE